MFSQHWAQADGIGPALGRQSVLQVCPDYKTPISGDCSDYRLIRGNMLCKVLNIADLFCLHGNMRPGNTTISLFFGALKLFFPLFRIFS